MKKFKILTLALISVLLIVSACKKLDPGELTTETRTLETFSAIDVESAINVYVTKGDTEEVKVETGINYMQHVITKVSGGVLKISVDKSNFMHYPNRHHEIKVYVTTRSLTAVNASGASKVICTGSFDTGSFNINLSGASKLNCSVLNSGTTYVDASGASEINITGSTKTLSISDLSGASEVSALNFTSDFAYLELSGASEATINVTTDLNVKASGASEIKYLGNPGTIRKELSGASQLVKL